MAFQHFKCRHYKNVRREAVRSGTRQADLAALLCSARLGSASHLLPRNILMQSTLRAHDTNFAQQIFMREIFFIMHILNHHRLLLSIFFFPREVVFLAFLIAHYRSERVHFGVL